jgi:hypothetical protein
MNEKKKEDKGLTCRILNVDADTVKISKREVSLHPPGSDEIVSSR